jgi:hypothetical protein
MRSTNLQENQQESLHSLQLIWVISWIACLALPTFDNLSALRPHNRRLKAELETEGASSHTK